MREGDVAEIDHAIGRDRNAFGKDQAAVEELFELRIRQHDRIGGACGRGEQKQDEQGAAHGSLRVMFVVTR